MTVELLPQHLQALEAANRVRLYRSALRQQVNAYRGPDAHGVGRAKLAAILCFPPAERESFKTLRVVDMLTWVKRLNRPIAVRYAAACGISEFATAGQITNRQRLQLVDLLREGIEALKLAESEREIEQWVADHNARSTP